MPIDLYLDEICTDCKEAEFFVKNGVIRNPGKFSAEPLDTYHAYHLLLDGFADDSLWGDSGEVDRIGRSFIEITDQGFVIGTHYDSDESADQAWDALQDEFSSYPPEEFDGDDQDRHERDQELLQDDQFTNHSPTFERDRFA